MNTKRFISIAIAIVLLISCMSISASAEDPSATISLTGESNAVIGAEYKVALNVSESSADVVGGLSCDVTYNTDTFSFKRVEMTSDFAAANYVSADGYSETISQADGKISVVLLDVDGDTAENRWLTLVFEVLSSQGSANFTLDNAKVSDTAGTELITSDLSVDIVRTEGGVVDFHKSHTNANGASIKKDVTDEQGNVVGNIRFEAQLSADIDKSTVSEIGFVMLPTVCLDNGELTVTENGKYTMANGREVSIAYNGKSIDSLSELEDRYYCYLTNTMEFPLTMSFAARPYVKLKDGTYVYGYNDVVENNIVGGTSNKSCIDIAKAIYNEYVTKYPSYDFIAIADIVALDANQWTTENYQTVVNALVAAESTVS